MSSEADDDLARTATADASQPSAPSALKQPGETIGRYRIERTLGIGGMGVVHVAFDPDLERRVALKVLRTATGEDAARRLQREARAMARLSHTNVVTVHEVGSVAGRDYVAMELIDGESLAEWLRAQKRDPRAIVDAFIQAGRGLAAAHAAGIVHRDFKPHNVLRSRSGRICVTDFGLAREASDPLAITAVASGNTPTSLSGLTMSGSVLGTPAYMAPEQWQGGEVTAQADQFGFCVALWEALSGERPYRGPTVDDLKVQVAAGPEQLDPSRIPRKLRPILRRGLDPSSAKRWGSMNELLDQLERARRRPWLVFAAVGAAAIAAAVLFLVLRGGSSAPSCPAPALDPDVVWNDQASTAAAAADQGPSAKLLAADLERWRHQRTLACAYEPARRVTALTCLDGVLARFSTVARAVTTPGQPPLDAGLALIDPVVCATPAAPRLVGTVSEPLAEAIAMWLRDAATEGDSDEAAMTALVDRTGSDPCAEAIAQSMLGQNTTSPTVRDRAGELAEQASDRCGDDRIRAEVALGSVMRALQSTFVGPTFTSRIARAEAAVQRVSQADLVARLAELHAPAEARTEKLDKALDYLQQAVAGYAARGRVEAEVRAGLSAVKLRETRANAEDVAVIASSLRSWRSLAVAELGDKHPILRTLERFDAGWAWANGDAAGAHARLEALRRQLPNPDGRAVAGLVVDAAGQPVAGATVAVGKGFNGDGISIAFPLDGAGHLRVTTTGPDGRFSIPDAVPDGIALAQLGDQRSDAVAFGPELRLALRPTSRISGTVDLRGMPATKVIVAISPHAASTAFSYNILSPVSRDGTYAVDGIPRGDLDVAVAIDGIATSNLTVKRMTVTEPVIAGVMLAVPVSKRSVTFLVRSTVGTPPMNAQIMIVPAALPEKIVLKRLLDQFGDMGALSATLARPLDGTLDDQGMSKAGDLAVRAAVPEGAASACGFGLPNDIGDPAIQKAAEQHGDRIEIHCVAVPANASVVLVTVPPWPRFD